MKKKKYLREMNLWLVRYRTVNAVLHRDIQLLADSVTRLVDTLEADSRFRRIVQEQEQRYRG